MDGIHFDDYFYPAQDASLDSAAYSAYTQSVEEPLSLPAWRTANSKRHGGPGVREHQSGGTRMWRLASRPRGHPKRRETWAPTWPTWAAVPGYVDYLAPQLYYSFENQALPYQQALEKWVALPPPPGAQALRRAGAVQGWHRRRRRHLAQPGRHHRPAGGGGFAKRLPGGAAVLLGSFQQPAGR